MKVLDRTCYMTEDDFRIVSGLAGHRTGSQRKSFVELSEDAMIVRVVWQSKKSLGIETKARLKRRKLNKRILEYNPNPHVANHKKLPLPAEPTALNRASACLRRFDVIPHSSLSLLFKITANGWLWCIFVSRIGLNGGNPQRFVPIRMENHNLNR